MHLGNVFKELVHYLPFFSIKDAIFSRMLRLNKFNNNIEVSDNDIINEINSLFDVCESKYRKQIVFNNEILKTKNETELYKKHGFKSNFRMILQYFEYSFDKIQRRYNEYFEFSTKFGNNNNCNTIFRLKYLNSNYDFINANICPLYMNHENDIVFCKNYIKKTYSFDENYCQYLHPINSAMFYN